MRFATPHFLAAVTALLGEPLARFVPEEIHKLDDACDHLSAGMAARAMCQAVLAGLADLNLTRVEIARDGMVVLLTTEEFAEHHPEMIGVVGASFVEMVALRLREGATLSRGDMVIGDVELWTRVALLGMEAGAPVKAAAVIVHAAASPPTTFVAHYGAFADPLVERSGVFGGHVFRRLGNDARRLEALAIREGEVIAAETALATLELTALQPSVH